MKAAPAFVRAIPGAVLLAFFTLPACDDDDDVQHNAPAEGGAPESGGRAGTGGAPASGGSPSPGGAGGVTASGGRPLPDAGRDAEVLEGGAEVDGAADARAPLRSRWLAFTLQGLDTQPLYVASTEEGKAPVRVAPNVSGFTPPTWRTDGKQLLFVDYFCCGASNAARVVDFDAEGAGDPVVIHPPLEAGKTIRDADYSPDGRWLLALFVDETNTGRWSIRRADAAPDAWLPITAGAPWAAGQRRPTWAENGRMGVLVEGSGIAEGQRVYALDLSRDPPTAELARESPAGEGGVTSVDWHPAGDGFVLVSDAAILWAHGAPRNIIVEPVSSGTQRAPYSVAFSADGSALLFSAAGDTENTGLYSRPVSKDGVGDERSWFSPPATHVASIHQLAWDGTDRVLFIGDAEKDDVFELYERSGEGPVRRLSAQLAGGASVSGFAVLGPRVAYSAQEADGATQNVLWVHPGPDSVEAVTTFAAGSSGWAGLSPPAPVPVGFFTAMEVDASSGNVMKARLSLLDGPSGSVHVAGGPLPDGAYFTNPYAWSPDSRWFAYVADSDADGISEAWVIPLDGGRPGVPRAVANLFDAPGGAPGAFTWQP